MSFPERGSGRREIIDAARAAVGADPSRACLEVPVARDPPAIVFPRRDDRDGFPRARPSRSNPARTRPDFNNEEIQRSDERAGAERVADLRLTASPDPRDVNA